MYLFQNSIFTLTSLCNKAILVIPGKSFFASPLSRQACLQFKEFYTLQVRPHWQKAFPNLVSYNRFVELMPWSMMLLCCFLQTRKGEVTGISFIDSTPIEVCCPSRSYSHKVFEGLVGWSKNSVAWHAARFACKRRAYATWAHTPCDLSSI